MRAIDLYAGVGGWSVGLKLAGFDVVQSFEWWTPAVDTHRNNLSGTVRQLNIRELDLDSLPDAVDVVVGSPPCTQFSYSNRGGSGDVADGLEDLYAFLRVVDHIKPKHWAFENVPRVKGVIEKARTTSGKLEEFQHLLAECTAVTVDMSDFGIPQTRRRCIVGNFDELSLLKFAHHTKPKTLGQVVCDLKAGVDPIYSKTRAIEITDNEPEPHLNFEETRFNRDMKTIHPIYNGMSFPDRSDKPSRTITATCTRVSRESIIYGESDGKYRRLSVRERASIQTFPATYQFHGKSHAEKLKMVGNAIPPYFTYQLGEVFKGNSHPIAACELPVTGIIKTSKPPKTSPDRHGRVYPFDRRFRFSVPNLNFKSGTRFELSNSHESNAWKIDFFFGNSKQIAQVDCDAILARTISRSDQLSPLLQLAQNELVDISPENLSSILQNNWNHSRSDFHPFNFLDKLGMVAGTIIKTIHDCSSSSDVSEFAIETCRAADPLLSMRKIEINSVSVGAGLILGCAFNQMEDK